MDFKNWLIDFFSSFLIVIRRIILLIFTPYKTMRKISHEKDYSQIVILLGLIFIYFQLSHYYRKENFSGLIVYLIFLFGLFFTAGFFYFMSCVFRQKTNFSSYLFSFTYATVPTLIWFISNFVLYLVLPPPRTMSVMGKGFSIFFTAYSLSLLSWKFILFYLSIRFSSRMPFYRIFYTIFIYLCWFIPYSILLYQVKIFRVPFI